MKFRKLTPLAGLVALALVAGAGRTEAAAANDSSPGRAGIGIDAPDHRPRGQRRGDRRGGCLPGDEAFAEKSLPTLRKHHAEAQRLKGTVGRGG